MSGRGRRRSGARAPAEGSPAPDAARGAARKKRRVDAEASAPRDAEAVAVGSTDAAAAGDADAGALLGGRGLVDRTEFVRLLAQSLGALGHEGLARGLEAASGVRRHAPGPAALRAAVERGDWAAAAAAAPRALGAAAAPEAARLIEAGHFRDALRAGDDAAALASLRRRAAGGEAPARLRALGAELLRAPGAAAAGGDPRAERTRALAALAALAAPGALLPPARLEALVEAALDAQLDAAPYLNDPASRASLLADYACAPLAQVPCRPGAAFEPPAGRFGAFLHAAFSPDGAQLAASTACGRVCLFAVRGRARLELRRVLDVADAGEPATHVAWAPSGGALAACCDDGAARVVDTRTGAARAVWHDRGGGGALSAAFASGAGGELLLVSASAEKVLVSSAADGATRRVFYLSPQAARDVAVLPGAAPRVLATTAAGRVRALGVAAPPEAAALARPLRLGDGPVAAFSLSRDGRRLLAQACDGALALWELGAAAEGDGAPGPAPSRLASMAPPPGGAPGGAPGERRLCRAALGGLGERFALCGTAGGEALLYSARTGELLARWFAHAGGVTACAWSPADPSLAATVGADGALRCWVPAAEGAEGAGNGGVKGG
jgi:WD40 repeat protein